MNYKKRIQNLQKLFESENIEALFITNPSNIFYLTGFRGVSSTERETSALIEQSGLILFAPRLYQSEVSVLGKKNGFNFQILDERNYLFSTPSKMFGSKKVGVESDDLKLSELEILKNNSKAKIKFVKNLIESLRLVKDDEEIDLVKHAVKITDKIFTQIKNEIKAGLTEKHVTRKIVEMMEKEGADGVAFDPMVASGVNSSFPHHISSNKVIEKGVVLIDAGARYRGYNADLTRTFYLGKPDQRFIKTYNFLLSVQEKVIKSVREGVLEEDTWKSAVAFLGNKAKFFTHSLGHGIGIDVHEAPFLGRGRRQKLKENMLLTIEPGLYFPGWGGIRIEDYIQVTTGGRFVLSNLPKKLEDIVIET